MHFGGVKSDKKKLRSHMFFEKSSYWLTYQIDSIELPSHRKENMAKKFLSNYVIKFKEMLTAYINNGDFNHPEELLNLYLKTMKYVNSSSLAIGIPQLFLDKYDEYQDAQTIAINEELKNIISSSFYRTNMDKIIAIFDVITYAFIYVILNAEESLTNMNGELEKALEGTIFDT